MILAASAHLHQLHGLEPTELLDIPVTCNGTWSKRGFTAIHGVVVVIAWESGQVLDYEIKTKRCSVCALKKEKMVREDISQDSGTGGRYIKVIVTSITLDPHQLWSARLQRISS